jgi:hypothetical protein
MEIACEAQVLLHHQEAVQRLVLLQLQAIQVRLQPNEAKGLNLTNAKIPGENRGFFFF